MTENSIKVTIKTQKIGSIGSTSYKISKKSDIIDIKLFLNRHLVVLVNTTLYYFVFRLFIYLL